MNINDILAESAIRKRRFDKWGLFAEKKSLRSAYPYNFHNDEPVVFRSLEEAQWQANPAHPPLSLYEWWRNDETGVVFGGYEFNGRHTHLCFSIDWLNDLKEMFKVRGNQ